MLFTEIPSFIAHTHTHTHTHTLLFFTVSKISFTLNVTILAMIKQKCGDAPDLRMSVVLCREK